MADKNLNQGKQSRQDWDKDRNRSNQNSEWSSQNENSNYGSGQNRNMNQRFGDVGYSGDSAHGMGAGNEGDYNRINYMPDNDDNRNYGNTGYRSSGMDYDQGGYRNENRGNFGNAGYGNDYNPQDWRQQQNYGNNTGNQYQNDNDWNRRQMSQGGGSWSSDHGWQGRNRSQVNYGNQNQGDWSNRGYGNTGNDNNRNWGNAGNDYNQNWNRNRHKGDDRYDSRRQGNDENWWERTKDKVSDWFDKDDDNNRNRNEWGNSHRGKGPTDYRRSQDRIREDICDRLTDDDRVDASHIRVQIEEDVVILTGNVNSREEKRRAEDLVESVSGVHNVENRLRVGTGTGVDKHLSSHDYTGATDRAGNIGTESGTTNEVIRNVQNEDRISDKEIK